MFQQAQRRVALVGIDGFSPPFIERYLREGAMPALKALMERGVTIPLVSTIPATTPVAWAAMSTGTYPATNGIEGFLLHRPGRCFDDRLSGVYADQLNAEPIWQTAFLNGLSSFVVKFPVSYPSVAATLRIDGAAGWGGLTCLHEIAGARTNGWPENKDGTIEQSAGWRGAVPNGLVPLWFGTLTLPNVWGRAPIVFALAVSARDADTVVSIAHVPDWQAADTTLGPSEWSEPILVEAVDRRGERRRCAARFKALAVGRAPLRLRLFNTPVHELEGHTNADDRWRRHLLAAGPIEEQTDPTPLFSGAIDMATHVERCRLNTDWLCRVSRSILESEPWNLFMVHTHIVDWAHHLLHGAVDPRHPLYDAARADEADSLIRRFYAMTDELVASVVESAGGEANVIVMGDHGQDLHHTTVRLNNWLAETGQLTFADGNTSAFDWTRTRACIMGNGLYLNVAGRDPKGIVDPSDSSGLLEELCHGLCRITDPRTGERVVLIAAPREHFAYLGGHGQGAGDIVFCLQSGYQGRNDRGPMFEITRPWQEFTSGHDHFWPLDPRVQTRMFAAGPYFRSTSQPMRLRPIVDVAPTIAAVLGIDVPPDIDGVAIAEVLVEPTAARDLQQASL